MAASSSPRLTSPAPTARGRWTDGDLLITTHSLGAVEDTMKLAEASKAAGVSLATHGDGTYSDGAAPGLFYQLGFGPNACLGGTASSLHTAEGIRVGDSLERLQAVFGARLKFYSADPGMNDPTSYYVSDGQGFLFFHLTDKSRGNIRSMVSGDRLGAAYC